MHKDRQILLTSVFDKKYIQQFLHRNAGVSIETLHLARDAEVIACIEIVSRSSVHPELASPMKLPSFSFPPASLHRRTKSIRLVLTALQAGIEQHAGVAHKATSECRHAQGVVFPIQQSVGPHTMDALQDISC